MTSANPSSRPTAGVQLADDRPVLYDQLLADDRLLAEDARLPAHGSRGKTDVG